MKSLRNVDLQGTFKFCISVIEYVIFVILHILIFYCMHGFIGNQFFVTPC